MQVTLSIINKRTKRISTYDEWSKIINTRHEFYVFIVSILNSSLPKEGYNYKLQMLDVTKGREDRFFYSLKELFTFIEGIFFTISFGENLK